MIKSVMLIFELFALYYIKMRDNRPFTEKEDQIIRNLYEKQNIKKWSMIARALTEEYNLARNAKQCRDRYRQHIDPLMATEWTLEEEQKLYHEHNQIGNKWAVIAQKFPGRTDNCVKNHFYAKLRKSLRHLNKLIKQNFRKQFKELKIGAIYKIIEVLEDRFNENTMIEQDVFNKCLLLKKQLLEYSNEQNDQTEGDFQKQRQLIREIVEFNKTYKRKTKKQRRSSLNGADLFKPASMQKRIKYSSDQSSSQSQYSMGISHRGSDNLSEESEVDLIVIQEDIRESMNSNIRESLNSKYEPRVRFAEKLEGDEDPARNQLKFSYKSNNLHQVQEILKGVIEQGEIYQNRPDPSFCSISLRSESEKADMFDDNLRISEGLRNIEEMDEQEPEDSIFRSHR